MDVVAVPVSLVTAVVSALVVLVAFGRVNVVGLGFVVYDNDES